VPDATNVSITSSATPAIMSTSDSSHEDEVCKNAENNLLSKQTPTVIKEKIDDPTKFKSPSIWEKTISSTVDTSSTSNDQIDFSIFETAPFV